MRTTNPESRRARGALCRSLLTGILTGFGLLAAWEPGARAAVITLNVIGTEKPFVGVACTPACTLGGTLVIDNTAGTILSVDITATGFSPNVGPFNQSHTLGIFSGFLTTLSVSDSGSHILPFAFATPTPGSLVGFTGGDLSTIEGTSILFGTGGFWELTSGSLTQEAVAVPEPSSVLGFFTMLMAAYMTKRRCGKGHV
jgi:hypothetical protein